MKPFSQDMLSLESVCARELEPDKRNLLSVLKGECPRRPTMFELFLNDRIYWDVTQDLQYDSNDPYARQKRIVDACCRLGYDCVSLYGARVRFPVRKVDNAFDIDAVSLANVATHFEKHPNYLSTSFPVWTGINFKEYVSGKRLDKAAQELRKSGAVVGAVANSLGYYNVSNFIRVFKERFHMTPGQYHEQAMAEERERQVDSPEK